MIVFCTEPWTSIRREIMPLWIVHHKEIADQADVGYITLDPDWTKYSALADRGSLHITAARKSGVLVGYIFAVVETGLHYRSTLFAHIDLYWIDPERRGDWAGVRMFREFERAMRARGVVKLTGGRKLWMDTGPIFRRLGWKDDEVRSSKWIGS